MHNPDGDLVKRLVSEITSSRKYRSLCPETVWDVVTKELARQSDARTAIRVARERLHRLWAQFLGEPDYDACLRDLAIAFGSGDEEQVTTACTAILRTHASTRERLPDLRDLYSGLFAVTGLPSHVADLACALNPLAFRWMGLPRNVWYDAYDINRQVVEFLNAYFKLEGLPPRATMRDILCTPVNERVDVALLLKMYHCLEHRERGAGWKVVEGLPARWVAISFPTANLRGRAVDIAGNYEPFLLTRAADAGWPVHVVVTATEKLIVLHKGAERGDR